MLLVLEWPTSRPIAKCTTADPGEEGQVWVWARTFCREEDAWSDKTSAMILVIVWPNTWTYNRKTKKTESSFHGHNHNVSCSDADFGKGTTILGHQLRLSLKSPAVRHIESVRCQIFENRKTYELSAHCQLLALIYLLLMCWGILQFKMTSSLIVVIVH